MLDDQRDEEESIGVFFRHDNEHSAFLVTELLGIQFRVETQELFKFRVKECVQSRKGGTHDRVHGLLRRIERRSRKPSGFVVIRQKIDQGLELVLPTDGGGCQEFLNDLEHGHDMPLAGLSEFSHQQYGRCQESFSGIVEVSILPERGCIHPREDDRFGNNLRVFFRFCSKSDVIWVLLRKVHVLVDQMKQVVAV